MREPVVIMGTHRSGTTLLIDLLRRLGFFPGARLEHNLESWFFLRRNEWLMRRAGGAWDRPLPVRDLLRCEALAEEALALFQREVLSRRFAGFTGAKPRRLEEPWGWKDPRNTFTWPVWRRVFPGARLIVLRRNGVDVARSLYARANRESDPYRSVLSIRPLASRFIAALHPMELLGHHFESARCTSLEASFELWEEYAAEAESAFDSYDGPKLALKFEDLARDPEPALAVVAEFAGLHPSRAELRAAAGVVRPERASAFASDPRALELWQRARKTPCMERLGYDRSPEDPS